MRIERDFIGTVEIPDHALYGIHSLRAVKNFPDTGLFHTEWYQAAGTVKKACYMAYRKYAAAVRAAHPGLELPVPLFSDTILDALVMAAEEVENGTHRKDFIVPALQGGAGTSINMNVNEIIANRALQALGHHPGEYGFIDPIEHANIFQSTNDVIPTSLRVAVMRLLTTLETTINSLRTSLEEKEKISRHHLRIAYTQMQEAVPSSYGRLFSAYCDAMSRDWWRVSKCYERIKVVNLGGSAIGTGITVPRYFISEVTQVLQQVSGLPLTRAENMHDATSNLDAFVEVHAILKAHAVNLQKMVSDIRLLSSDLARSREIRIPQLQTGSSVMPGKVNPVVPEFIIISAHKVYANDQLISSLCAMGCLDLNAYLPAIGHAMIESLKLLIACDETLKINLLDGLTFNDEAARSNLLLSPSITTALLPFIGYHRSAQLAKEMKSGSIGIVEANRKLHVLPEAQLLRILEPSHLLKEGFTLNDIIENHGERKGE
jgi:aspartate ammonia-lyase